MTIVLLAEGFEEIEALTPVDMLRRAGAEVKTVSCQKGTKTVVGSHGITVVCDLIPDEVDTSDIDTVILPGGMPGSLNLDKHPFTDIAIQAAEKNGGRLAAICAAPLVLGRRGLLNGKRATCYPGFEKELIGAEATGACIVTDGNITTSRGMGTAIMFAEELVRLIVGSEKSEELSLSIKKPSLSEYATNPTSEAEDGEKDQSPFLFVKGKTDDSLEELLENNFEECNEEAELTDSTVEDDTDTSDMPEAYFDPSDEILLKIIELYESFRVKIRVVGKEVAPQVSRYLIFTYPGVRASSVTRYADDLTLALGVSNIRMIAPIKDKALIGIEVPNKKRRPSYLKDILHSDKLKNTTFTTVPIGEGYNGEIVTADIAKCPHLIIGGITGSGTKSLMHSILTSLVFNSKPEELRLLLIDPTQIEFNEYEGLPNLLCPPLTNIKESIGALMWANEEMERRFRLIEKANVRSIDTYNEKAPARLPKIIICINKFEDLMLVYPEYAEGQVMRIAQKARAAGIHLILCTENPTYKVLSGAVKANIPTRIAARVVSSVDSRIILDATGAEKLLGFGDILYAPVSTIQPIRTQLAFVSESERNTYFENCGKDCDYDGGLTDKFKELAADIETGKDDSDQDRVREYLNDETFCNAVRIAFEKGAVSTSLLHRKLSIGYGKAAKYIDAMEEMGIVSAPNGQKNRELLITYDQWLSLFEDN